MLIYFGIAIFLGIGAIIEQINENRKLKEGYFLFSIFLLILFFGMRGYIGYDWYSYKPNFDRGVINFNYIFKSGYEFGFQIYTLILKNIVNNYFFYNILNTIIDILTIFWIIKKYSKYNLLSLFLFFSVYGIALEIDMIRNMKSILLFLISIRYIEERKIWKFLLLNILGIFFHISSIIYLPMYFILNKKWSKKIILILFLIGNIYYLLDSRIVLKLIQTNSFILPTTIGLKLSNYFSMIPLDFPLGFSFYYMERVIIFILIYLASEHIQNQKYGNIVLNSLYISIFFFLYSSEFSIISMRFSLLFIYSYWFIFSYLFNFYSKSLIFIIVVLISFFRIDNQINFIGNKEIYFYQNILLDYNSEEIQRKKVEEAGKYKIYGHGKEISLLF